MACPLAQEKSKPQIHPCAYVGISVLFFEDLQNPRAWFMLRWLWIRPNPQEADMKFGLFQSVQLPEPGAQAKYYREALEQVRWAEDLGYHSVWFTEHHFSRHGIVPASMAVLAYLAGVTRSIRLATAVAVLPFHNPIQLAEEAATVDVLSDGRLDFGVGRGYQWGEFHKFNIPMDEATRRFEESLEVMTKAWTATEPFDHRGEFWSFNDMTLHPKPIQTPHPPIWVAASHPTSMDRVARHNWNCSLVRGRVFNRSEPRWSTSALLWRRLDSATAPSASLPPEPCIPPAARNRRAGIPKPPL